MRKTICSLVLILMTLICMAATLVRTKEEVVQARVVTVQRGDVHQVVALSGRLEYTDETFALAPANATINRILVETGQRIAEGEAILRFSSGIKDGTAQAYAEYRDMLSQFAAGDLANSIVPLQSSVLRAERSCTVRQVLIDEDMPVLVGTPMIRMTSNEQQIVCNAIQSEVDRISEGMWAWLTSSGESLGFAEVLSVSELCTDALTGLPVAEITLRPEQHIDLPESAAVDVDVYIAGSDDVLTLPVEAITDRDTVWWVSNGRCTEIPAEIVMCDEIHAWVTLPEGMKVAVGEFMEGQRIVEAAS